MSNLTVENVGQIVQHGDVEGFLGLNGGAVSEQQVQREMRKEGLGIDSGQGVPGAEAGKTFSDVLNQSVEKVNEMQHEADHAIKELVAGRTKNIHETMLAVERADSSLKLAMQVRNKILDAYREIMRMQV